MMRSQVAATWFRGSMAFRRCAGRWAKLVATAATAVMILACGGGGGGSSTDGSRLSAQGLPAGDTVVFFYPRNNYIITISNTVVLGASPSYDVQSFGTALPDGTSAIPSTIRSLVFTDLSVNLGIGTKSLSISPADLKSLAELYIAYFNRVPDADGLSYWIDQFKAGQTLDQIGAQFYAAALQYASVTGYTASMTNTDFISLVYRNVLGRSAPDQAGLNYWNAGLSDGSQTRGTLVKSMLSAAHAYKGDATYGPVADLLDNKYVAAYYFAVQQGLSYRNATDSISRGMAIAAAVTASDTAAAIALVAVSDTKFQLAKPLSTAGTSATVVSPLPTVSVSLNPSSVSATFPGDAYAWGGQMGTYTTATLSGLPTSSVYAYVIDAGSVLNPGFSSVTKGLDGTYSAWLPYNFSLAPGTYKGSLQLELCQDAACQKPYRVSGGSLPYVFTVLPAPQLTMTVNGVSLYVPPGRGPIVKDGDLVVLTSSLPVSWSVSSGGVIVRNQISTTTSWSAKLNYGSSTPGDTVNVQVAFYYMTPTGQYQSKGMYIYLRQ